MRVPVELLEDHCLPYKAYTGAACSDLRAREDVIILPGVITSVPLGIKMEIPKGNCGILTHRSGMNRDYGIIAYGTIDDDYRGEIVVNIFMPTGRRPVRLEKGSRIAQLRIVEVPHTVFDVVEKISEDTERGSGGFGSSGMS